MHENASTPAVAGAWRDALHAAMRREAARTGWPVIYRTDLEVHDRLDLAAVAEGERCLWLLRETGTDLLPLGRPWARALALHWLRPGAAVRAYLIVGGRSWLLPLSQEAARRAAGG